MMIVWKYPFEIQDEFVLQIPQGWKILHVELQNSVPCMWVLVDQNSERVGVKFRIVGTGHEHSDLEASRHIATFQVPPFVWHLFYDS